jgi:hypothetical protein
MNDDEARQYIFDHVSVPRLHVIIAKGFILKNFTPRTEELTKKFLDSVDARMPQKLVLLGIGKKIQIVLDLYSHQAVFGEIRKTSGVRLQELKNCVVWADCVRDSRNSIHYGAEPPMSNSYEKVASLMIGAVPHIRLLVALTNEARRHSG